jgi:hypothetical protein
MYRAGIKQRLCYLQCSSETSVDIYTALYHRIKNCFTPLRIPTHVWCNVEWIPLQIWTPCCTPARNRTLSHPGEWSRAIVQTVSRWFPTAAARLKSRGICGGRSGTGAGFSQSTSVSPANSHSTDYAIITIWSWYNRPTVAALPSRLNLTPLIIMWRYA